MTPKERMFNCLEGVRPDVLPAAPCYLSLYLEDRMRAGYIELYRHWMKGRSRRPVDHDQDTQFRLDALYHSYDTFKARPDWIEVGLGASKSWAEHIDIVRTGAVLCYEDKTTGYIVPMHSIPIPVGDGPLDEENQSPYVSWDFSARLRTRKDVDSLLPVTGQEELFAKGLYDLPRLAVNEYGDQYFISAILDTPYSDAYSFLGFKDLMVIQRKNPDLFHYLLHRRLEQDEHIMEAWAATGVHGVYVEEVFSGADAISPRSYDQFVYRYNQPYFQHMHSLGLLPIHYVCGDALPRLDQIVEYDIAAVAVEESKKKFRLEISEVVDRIAGRKTVFGNIDSIHFGIHATADEMSAEVKRQAGIGDRARGFIASTGSPFPLETNPRMIDALVNAAHSIAYN
jgi:uroporphyrinogen-III decarboxylase